MATRRYTFWTLILAIAVCATAVTLAQTAKSDAMAAVTKLENDGVKADLANDKAFYEKILADDWTAGDSRGMWVTKADVLKMADDPKNNKTNSEELSDLKVRAYGDTAIATFKVTYDGIMNGEHRASTIIGTDAWVKIGGQWKLVASHGSKAK